MFQQESKKVSATVGTWRKVVSGVPIWIVMTLILSAFLATFVLGNAPLGPMFVPTVAGCLLVSGVLSTIAVLWMYRASNKEQASPNQRTLDRKKLFIWLSVMIPVTSLLAVASPIAVREWEERNNASKADQALEQFDILSNNGGNRGFQPEALHQTVADLESGYQQLKNTWTLPEAPDKIRVELFRNHQEYVAYLGNPYVRGHVQCREHGPIIFIPLEMAPSVMDGDSFSRTPMHEMVHALMCQSLGQERFFRIPRWFHEGVATRYAAEGFSRVGARLTNKLKVWSHRKDPIEARRLCSQWFIPRDADEDLFFYRTSLEFVTYLEFEHGNFTLNELVEDVRKGSEFDRSFQTRLGSSCESLYLGWVQSFQ